MLTDEAVIGELPQSRLQQGLRDPFSDHSFFVIRVVRRIYYARMTDHARLTNQESCKTEIYTCVSEGVLGWLHSASFNVAPMWVLRPTLAWYVVFSNGNALLSPAHRQLALVSLDDKGTTDARTIAFSSHQDVKQL
jgi:hypothetical protein